MIQLPSYKNDAAFTFAVGDCMGHTKDLPDDSVDLVLTSPPYEDARTYGYDHVIAGEQWVRWAAERFIEHYRICRGLVAWVVEGRTLDRRWSATPALLMADLHRAGVRLRHPAAYWRVGIPGSGGREWLRNDWEFIICASKGPLPWADNTACGMPPRYAPGGAPSHRVKDGRRVDGEYKPPKRTNPGNVVSPDPLAAEAIGKGDADALSAALCTERGDLIRGAVGGGLMGHPAAHDTEAPFPLWLAEFFVKSFCPPAGIVYDPFAGSGTTMHACWKHARRCMSSDIRPGQIELCKRRLAHIRGEVDEWIPAVAVRTGTRSASAETQPSTLNRKDDRCK